MKLVKQVVLVQTNGGSTPKVYEIDLCEVGDGRFVVNYRHGKRGVALADGSKTPAPVSRADADKVFDKLMWSKIADGYVREGEAAATSARAPSTGASTPAAPAQRSAAMKGRAERVLQLLEDARRAGNLSTTEWPIDRIIWRAGELGLREAVPALVAMIGTAPARATKDIGGEGMREYCIAWSLARIGGDDARAALERLAKDAPSEPARRIALEGLWHLSDEETRKAIADDTTKKLPVTLVELARGASPEDFAAALAKVLESGANAPVLETLYWIDTPTTRPGFLDALARVPIKAPWFVHVRRIFKAAELRRDARVFGLLAWRFEKSAALWWSRWQRRRTGANRNPWSTWTREYMRRRVWRTLRRMGQLGDPDYARMAAGVLLPYTDADAEEPRQGSRYVKTGPGWRDYRYDRVSWDRFAPYLALNHVLYGKSSRYFLTRNRSAFELRGAQPGDPAPAAREEAFPEMWEKTPAALMQLMALSECTVVHAFAAKAARACPDFLASLDDDDVILLLGRSYEDTAALAFELADKRWDALRPNLALALAALDCVHAPARAKAGFWLDGQRSRLSSDAALLVRLVMARHADARQWARSFFRSSALEEKVASALVVRVIAALLALGPDDGALALDVADFVATAFAPHLRSIGVGPIKDLLAHPLPGVQQLGAELLLRHDARSGLIPVDVVLAVLHSSHANVRAVGLRLLSEVDDAALATFGPLLHRLCTDANADVRDAARPLVLRVARSFPTERDALALALIDALLRRRLAEDVPSSVLRVLLDELAPAHIAVPTDTIWRLLGSGSPHAQELGGVLLAKNVKPEDVPVDKLVELASHEILAVRLASRALAEGGLERIKREMPEAVRMLDAKWEDSRRWAMDFFRTRFEQKDFSADVLVSVADSVKPDVQAFGRELLTRHFRDEDGPALLMKLSEHPSRAVQLFATNYLDRFATGEPERLMALAPYFVSVLSRPSQGGLAKKRVLAFLSSEGQKGDAAAQTALAILHRVSATISVELRAAAIEAMLAIGRARPNVTLPIKLVPAETRARRTEGRT